MDRKCRNKQGKKSLAISVACMAVCRPTPGFKGRTFRLCVLTRWDFNSASAAPHCGYLPRERISRILDLREMLLFVKTGLNLVSAAVVCAILESISGLEPVSVINEPSYLKVVTISSFCQFSLISVLFVITRVFSALIALP